MRANPLFLNAPPSFWAIVRTISQEIGYTERGKDKIKVPNPEEIASAFRLLGITPPSTISVKGATFDTISFLIDYFSYRAEALNSFVKNNLMDANQAKREFSRLKKSLKPLCPLPNNKQKGAKKAPAYFTGIINMLIEKASQGASCDYNPRKLISVTKKGIPLRTMARRVDGAFPNVINPTAIWEIKEYYYTTTFGSRVADGIYETLLDGMELKELYEHERIKIHHYLMVDAYSTWWEDGKSYLCRIIDLLHMGYVDEVLFGKEVIERIPHLVKEWIELTE